MNIYEITYTAAVMCYRNTDELENRHAVCGEADENLYNIIYDEFCSKFEMMIRVMTAGASNEEEEAFLYYMAICSRGYEQWDKPKMLQERIGENLAEYVLSDVKLVCYKHERLTEYMMKFLNKSVHNRLFTCFALREMY